MCAELARVRWISQQHRIIKIPKSNMKIMKVNIYGPIHHINLLRTSRYLQLFRTKNFILFINSYVFYACLFDVTQHEDNL